MRTKFSHIGPWFDVLYTVKHGYSEHPGQAKNSSLYQTYISNIFIIFLSSGYEYEYHYFTIMLNS